MLKEPVGTVIVLDPLGCVTCITMFVPAQYQLMLVLASNWNEQAAVLTQVLDVPLNIAVAVF